MTKEELNTYLELTDDLMIKNKIEDPIKLTNIYGLKVQARIAFQLTRIANALEPQIQTIDVGKPPDAIGKDEANAADNNGNPIKLGVR